jgi:putative ABC transport system permease protein
VVSTVPVSGQNSNLGFAIEGVPTEAGRPFPHETFFRVVRPNYFRAMGVELLKGRDFDERDTLSSNPVVIINESLARKHFPDQDPIGRRINPSFSTDDRGVLWREIIGVVGDVRHASLSQESGNEVYVAHTHASSSTASVVARTMGDPHSIIAAAREVVRALDQNLPIYAVKTLEEYVASSVAQARFNMLLLGVFACVALALTAVGLYGVMAYSVTQRTHEIGVRMALGARAGDVLKLVVVRGMGLALAGVVLGVAASLALTGVMKSFLFGVSATDPLTFVLIGSLLAVVSFAACYIPARRATKVDPMVAIRYE